ncbi:cardiomyopathy-associated 5-like, putative [Babesia ovis]|uniref:Cardiomyopathy-associated 5-like, putative n=1 Tax=Babesia ovis TaxID=5869 RepID=A0A9W5TA76_BABOV|nr:cardiomyopathy-associated 5-like, putative [Babesia ovis]
MKSTSGRNNGFRKVAKWVLGVAAVAGVASGNVMANEAAETPEPTAAEQPSVVEQPAAEPVSENPPAPDVTEKQSPSKEPMDKQSPSPEVTEKESPSKEPVDKQTPSPEVTEKESPSKEPMDKQSPSPEVTEKESPSRQPDVPARKPVIVEEEPEEQSTGLFSCFQSSKKKKNKKNMRGTNSNSREWYVDTIKNSKEPLPEAWAIEYMRENRKNKGKNPKASKEPIKEVSQANESK